MYAWRALLSMSACHVVHTQVAALLLVLASITGMRSLLTVPRGAGLGGPSTGPALVRIVCMLSGGGTGRVVARQQ